MDYEQPQNAWLVINYNYTEDEIEKFKEVAENYHVNFILINEKDELINYINTKSITGTDNLKRMSDPINYVSVFSHGQVAEYGDVLSFGYNSIKAGEEVYQRGQDLYFRMEDIGKVDSNAFDSPFSKFYACNTGTTRGGTSFAQEWVNKTGGTATAVVDGQTNYSNINAPSLLNIRGMIDKMVKKQSRDKNGFSFSGSVQLPEAANGVKWKTFYPES